MILFVGNSYVGSGDLHDVTADLLAQVDAAWTGGSALIHEGYTWEDHLGQVTTPGTTWNDALVVDPSAWSVVVLQEQSQIPGFPQSDPTWQGSKEAGSALDDIVAGLGVQTILMQTWGRRDGDDENPSLYPDYPTMQDHLTAGYAAYADAFSTPDRAVLVAPIGEAFRVVYDDIVAAGEDPLASGGTFVSLYSGDGSHPSVVGTALGACVITATVTGHSTAALDLTDYVDADVAAVLTAAADEAVFGASSPPPPSGTTGPTSTPGESADDEAANDPGEGVVKSCNSAPGGMGLVALAVLGLRRKRRGW